MYAQVIVDIAHSDVDKVFEYSCDESVKLGSRVKVPFGPRSIDGFVIGLSSTCTFDPSKIRPITAVFDEEPAICKECVRLTYSIVDRYKVPKAVALRLFLPSEMRTGKVHEAYKNYVIYLGGMPLARAKKQCQAIEYLVKQGGECDSPTLAKLFGQGAISALVEKGFVKIEKRKIKRNPLKNVTQESVERVLTPAQESAVESILSTPKSTTLIHGVTGSGKTEIYLNIIARMLKEGKSAIFLVPEISLTPQMLSQLRSRFGQKAAIMHSGLSAGERFDEWWRLRSGEATIAIGARSAIFAPLENIGAIIIDEEHDSSYVSESSPRYSTVEIAKMRAEYNGAKLVLGSATPAVETYVKAQSGEYNLVTLTERINKRPLPEIIISDMRREVKRGNNSPFSSALKAELEDVLKEGKQAIIFLNRRGYSQTVICQDCGYIAKCEQCDVTLTYHSEDNCLKCHYCGAKYRMLPSCPECGGRHIRYNGTGTQRVVSELNTLFPSARIIRMDNDTVSGKDGHYRILKQFSEHQADILVGTQMIAKGHDFPSVTLVGILDADMSLHFADYRSGERTFQLITQVAGRSGRAGDAGKVVLQTYSPENYILRYAVRYDYMGFFKNEIQIRKTTLFPPYALIVRVMVVSADEENALSALKKVYFAIEELRQRSPEEFVFFNKMHSPIKKIQGKVRYQVLMRLTSYNLLEEIYNIAVQSADNSTLVYVEENPNNLS